MPNLDRRSLLAAAAAAPLAGASRAQERPPEGDPIDLVLARAPAQPGRTPHTRFAVNVEMWFKGLTFMQRVMRAHELGFPAIEFWPTAGKPLAELADFCADTGLEVAQFTAWGFTPGMNEPKNHAAFVRRIEEAVAEAKQLRCRKMTVVAGNDVAGMDQAEMHGHVIAALKLAKPIVEEAGVMLILEPMNVRVDHAGHCLYGSPDAVRICREVDSPMVKINWDLYHMQISEGDLTGRMREGFDQIGYFQLADHPGRREPGTGEIHYNRVLRAAYELGYRDFVGLECTPAGDDSARAARRVWAADLW